MGESHYESWLSDSNSIASRLTVGRKNLRIVNEEGAFTTPNCLRAREVEDPTRTKSILMAQRRLSLWGTVDGTVPIRWYWFYAPIRISVSNRILSSDYYLRLSYGIVNSQATVISLSFYWSINQKSISFYWALESKRTNQTPGCFSSLFSTCCIMYRL